MTQPTQTLEFSGVLGRATIATERATLRFYPYGFRVEQEGKPVLAVEIMNPVFDAAAVEGMDKDEVCEITVYEQRIEYATAYSDTFNKLAGSAVHTSWMPYDTTDLLERIAQLENWQSETSRQLREANNKAHEARNLIIELTRRAELKSEGSVEHATRQKAAIAVLKRLQALFDRS